MTVQMAGAAEYNDRLTGRKLLDTRECKTEREKKKKKEEDGREKGEERERRTAVGLNVECKVFYRPGGPARSASENQSGECEWSEIGRRANTGRCSFLDIDCFPLVPQTFESGAWSLLKFTGLVMYMPALPLTSRSLYVCTYYVSTVGKLH